MELGKHSEGTHVGPHYTLIIPFSPEMSNPKRLCKLLKSAGEIAEREIIIKYSKEKAEVLIRKLRNVTSNIKQVPNQKTMAILISFFAENVYFFTPTKRLIPPSL